MRALYARVYYSVMTDPKFAEVYREKWLLGWWLSLLLDAEQHWPRPTPIPAGATRRAIPRLVAVGLIDLVGDDRYQVHGLSKEREARSRKGQAAVHARIHGRGAHEAPMSHPWTPNEEPPPPASSHSTSTRTRVSTHTQSTEALRARAFDEETARYGLPHLSPAVISICEELTGRGMMTLNGKPAAELDRLCEAHEEHKVCTALRDVAARVTGTPSWVQLVYGAMKVLEPIPGAPPAFEPVAKPKPRAETPEEAAAGEALMERLRVAREARNA